MVRYFKNIDIFDKNILMVFLATSLVNLFNVLYQLLIAHGFSSVDFAAFSSLLSLFVLISAPLSTLNRAMVKYCAEFNAHNQTYKIKILFTAILKKVLIMAIITFFFFVFVSSFIMSRLKIGSVACGYILALLLASSWILPVLMGGIQGLELFKWLTSVSVISGGLKLILGIIFIWLGFNVAGALGALFLATLIGIVISSFALKKFILLKNLPDKINGNIGYKGGIGFNAAPGLLNEVNFRGFVMYLFPVALSSFCFMNLVNSDMILVKYFFPLSDAGSYSLAHMVGKIFLFLPGAISIVMFPKTAGLNAKNMDTIATLKRSLLYAFILCLSASVVYNLFPGFILKLLTGKTSGESIVLGRLFSVSMLFFALLFVLVSYFLSIRDLRFIKYLAFFSLLQFLAIALSHNSLIQVQLVLCLNSFILFLINLVLVNKKCSIV